MTQRYTRSGRFTVSKFQSICAETGKTIQKGEKCLYLPENKQVFHVDSNEAVAFKVSQTVKR